MRKGLILLLVGLVLALSLVEVGGLDRPMISDVYFYWYTWDYEKELGGWLDGVYYTPLYGYYESRSYGDNLHRLWLASEWGITHHFMDYWAPTWKALTGEPRELILMKAAEELQRRGYNCWMSYYQDGWDFEMKDFVRNLDEGRDVYIWLKNYAQSPAWPKLNGYPLQLVYGRNGVPEITMDDEGFRKYLQGKYGSVEKLNSVWGSSFGSFEEIRINFGRGWQRAESINYQYEIWEKAWGELNQRVKELFGFPGMKASFDVAYQPFSDYSYCKFAKLFGGPHSYGGIFGQPHEQDVQRFIQSVVAKYYDAVFFDHFKNNYCDWGIRIPGMEFPAEPFHFDRFWVGDLLRYDEAILHLSWNEWWEGSNLEPTMEDGKKFCEKNLFYSTLMQECFDSIRNYAEGSKVGLILNDWNFMMDSQHPEDLYNTIQGLRKLGVNFDLIADDFVTDKKLAAFQLIVAPACQVGFGSNGDGEPVFEVLKRWIEGGKGRKLLVSSSPEVVEYLDLQPAPPAAKPKMGVGSDMNVFIDVGEEGDEKFLLDGFSGREDWGKLSPEGFGVVRGRLTVRWTPGQGNIFTMITPVSPNREHIIRVCGNCMWGNKVEVLLDGVKVGEFEIIPEGFKEYELKIPAEALGDRKVGRLEFVYEKMNVPGEIDPERFKGESRVCNFAIDWLQISTSNIPKSREQNYKMPKEEIIFESVVFGKLKGKRIDALWTKHDLFAPAGKVLSRYASDNAPRDMLFERNGNEIIFVNGLLGALTDLCYLDGLLANWVKIEPIKQVVGEDVIGAVLKAGDTKIILVYNYDITKQPRVKFQVPTEGKEVAGVRLLARDGATYQDLRFNVVDGLVNFSDSLRYYGVYEVLFSPLKLEIPDLVIHPGESKGIVVKLTNLTGQRVEGDIKIRAVIPTIVCEAQNFSVVARGEVAVKLLLKAEPTIDWGRKTVLVELNIGDRRIIMVRPLLVECNPKLVVVSKILDFKDPVLKIKNEENKWVHNAVAEGVKVTVAGKTVDFGDIGSGEVVAKRLPVEMTPSDSPQVMSQKLRISYDLWGKRVEGKEGEILLAVYPGRFDKVKDTVVPLLIFNPYDRSIDNEVITIDMKSLGIDKIVDISKLYVRDSEGIVIPSQIDFGKELSVLVTVPAQKCLVLYLCSGEAGQPVATDLTYWDSELGTGKGKLEVSNSRYKLVLDERRGGTVSMLSSQFTGLDYGADTFGVTYGSWSKSDPLHPTHSAVDYVKEEKVRQTGKPAKIELAAGPLKVTAKVEWWDRGVKVWQTYEFYAYGGKFKIAQRIEPINLAGVEELVALDAKFKVNKLTKIFPNFTGIPDSFGENKPHCGWRQSPHIPDYATLMTPDKFEESISFLVLHNDGIDKFRQGFWPANRPKEGKCEYAEVEFVSTKCKPVDLQVMFMLHSGHQVVAKRAFNEMANPPLVILPEVEAWRSGSSGALGFPAL